VVSELLTQAQALEAHAIEAGEGTYAARRFLEQAARLRVQALGERSYPVVVCSECFRVTGWVDAGGLCDPCLRSRQREAAYSDPQGGFVVLGDSRPAAAPANPQAGPGLVGRLLGGKGARDRALVETWMKRVGSRDLLVPAEHSAGLPAEQLVDAWLDYRTAVDEFNRARRSPLYES
jgi:hypothetical protein